MRFYFPQRFLSVLLLLVALTCATQAGSLRARRSVWDNMENTLNNIAQTIKTMKTKVDSLLYQHSTTDPEKTLPIQPTLEQNETDFRHFIEVSHRCPPNHELVKERCRLVGR